MYRILRAMISASMVLAFPGCSTQLGPLPVEEASDKGNGELVVETIPKAPQSLPQALRVTFKNTSEKALNFTEPRSLSPDAPEESQMPPCLGLKLIDGRGRESQFPALIAELSKRLSTKPKTVKLNPGETWSKEYPLDAFHLWGPCGPAESVPEFFKPGPTPIKLVAFIVLGDGSAVASNSFSAKVTVPKNFFESPSLGSSEEDVDRFFDLMDESPQAFRKARDLKELIADLGESTFDLRLLAAREIGNQGENGKEAVPALIKLLHSDGPDRLLALYALEGIGQAAKEALPRIKDLAKDKSPRVREKAREASAKIEGKKLSSRSEPEYAGKPVSYWITEATKLPEAIKRPVRRGKHLRHNHRAKPGKGGDPRDRRQGLRVYRGLPPLPCREERRNVHPFQRESSRVKSRRKDVRR